MDAHGDLVAFLLPGTLQTLPPQLSGKLVRRLDRESKVIEEVHGIGQSNNCYITTSKTIICLAYAIYDITSHRVDY